MHRLAQLDHRFLWHPFTQMRDWLQREPIVIVEGKGAVLRDVRGREYLDANSSIWTNLHGHHHPKINAAIRRQLGKIAHSSALGLANEPASLLAEKLIESANQICDLRFTICDSAAKSARKSEIANRKLARSSSPTTARRPWKSRSSSPTNSPAARGARTACPRKTKLPNQNSFPWKARITATPSARSRSATLIYFTGLCRAAVQDGQGHGAVLLSLPVQPRQTRTRRRARIPQVQLGMRRQGGTEILRAEEKGKSLCRLRV